MYNTFFTDKIKKGEVKVAFCPMHEMLTDFLLSHSRDTVYTNAGKDTKPALQYKPRSSQECVGATKI